MKKMNIFKMMLAGAAALTLASCEKEFSFDNPFGKDNTGSRTETIGIQIEPMTKVTLSDDGAGSGNFAWEIGDQVSVYTATASDATGAFVVGEVKEISSQKKLEVTIPDGRQRFHYAVYPSNVSPALNVGTGALTITLPNSYTLAQVSGTKTPLPMVAANADGGDLTFYNVGGALRLTVNGIPTDATGMVFQFPENKVNGSFTVSNPGTTTSTIVTGTPDSGEDKITVTFDAGITSATVNIPLPTGDYEYVYVTSVGGSTKMAALQEIKAGGYTATRAHGKQLTTTMTLLPAVTRSDGGDEAELNPNLTVFPGELWYDFNSSNGDPIEISINENSENVRFYLNDDPAVVTLTGSGDPVSATWTGHNAFIESDDDLTVILDCNYVISNVTYDRAIECAGVLKLKTTGGTQTLTVYVNDDGKLYCGINGADNYDDKLLYAPDANVLAYDEHFTVSREDPELQSDGSYKWVYTVTPNP